MRILVVSGELISGDLAWRLQEEGNDVKLFVAHPLQADCQKGFVPRVRDWKKELRWVGKDGLIVFDDVGYGRIQDRLRSEGYRVFGGSEGGDRLEQDREFGMEVIRRETGVQTEPTIGFKTPTEAIAFIRSNPAAYVVKQNNHQSALNYVGQLEDGIDAISVLERYTQSKIRSISLQKRLTGVEVGVARYFNGHGWVGPIEISFEHKALFNDGIGPKTGEMGSLAWYTDTNPIYDSILDPLRPYLEKIGFHGDIAVNTFIDGQRIVPIEFTSRVGCPIVHLQGDLNRFPWNGLLGAIADGKDYDFRYDRRYSIVLTLALPPFPYEGISAAYDSAGLEVFFRENLTTEERKHIHFEGVTRMMDGPRERLYVAKSIGYTVFVTGTGRTVRAAQRSAYNLAKKIIIPKIFYRTDVGNQFLARDRALLTQWGWL